MVKKIFQFVSALVLLYLGYFLLGNDFVPFLQWWETIFILGIIFMPVTITLFDSFADKGYLFSKVIGIAVTGYMIWLLSSVKLLRFSSVTCILCVIFGLILNGVVLFRQTNRGNQGRKGGSKYTYLEQFKGDVISSMISQELMFLALFLLFAYIKGFKPEAYGTEKFMDYGFMTSMMRSDYMPPQDFWFSGTKLNYYYVGQFMATMLTKLSFVKVSYGYNLALMMLAAFAFLLPYSICYNLMIIKCKEQKDKPMIIPMISGLIAGAAVLIAGNMHYPIFKWLYPLLHRVLKLEGELKGYWFPDATRYIGYFPDTNDKTIHEFPSYSFVLGDLHAHVINIMFVLTVLGILFAWQLRHRREVATGIPVWKEIINPTMIMLSFLTGLFRTTNYWDFPIYYVVSGAVILFSNLVVYNFKRKALWLTGLQGIFIFVSAELISLPFTLNFDKISNQLRIAVNHSPLYQLIILWGLPIGMVIAFLCFLMMNLHRYQGQSINQSQVGKRSPILFRFMEFLQDSDLYVLTIGLCAIGLILLPELLYVEDIYSGDYKRANTMFKLTYQAYLMFGICFGYLFVRLISYGETLLQRMITIVGLILFVFTLFYAQNAVKAWFGNILDHKGYEGLDAAAFLETQMPEDHLAIRWLNENVTGMPVILEANGDSYSDYQRVSVMTGLPTVLGWRTHEWLWKSDPSLLDVRAADIETIYTSNDKDTVLSLVKKYGIQYIYVGKLEAEKYQALNHELLQQLGDMVYYSPTAQEKDYETYIIQTRYDIMD